MLSDWFKTVSFAFYSTAFFQCYVCHASVTVEIDRGRISEPALCRNCNTNHSMVLIHNRSQYTDKQITKLQESPGKWHIITIIVAFIFCWKLKTLTKIQFLLTIQSSKNLAITKTYFHAWWFTEVLMAQTFTFSNILIAQIKSPLISFTCTEFSSPIFSHTLNVMNQLSFPWHLPNYFSLSDDMPPGQTPHTIMLFSHNDLVDAVQPGDR